MSAVLADQRAWVLERRVNFAFHALARVRERACSDVERALSDGELQRWTLRAWNRAAALEVYQDPDVPALPTYVARVDASRAWYLVTRPCVIAGDVGILIISALRGWMYENNKADRWRPW